jgi:hypothetical protein
MTHRICQATNASAITKYTNYYIEPTPFVYHTISQSGELKTRVSLVPRKSAPRRQGHWAGKLSMTLIAST